jgi:hypothetical protein
MAALTPLMLALNLEYAIARRDHVSEESDWRTRPEMLSSAAVMEVVQLLSDMQKTAKTPVDTLPVSQAVGIRRRSADLGRTW